jgi:hypothetical protein
VTDQEKAYRLGYYSAFLIATTKFGLYDKGKYKDLLLYCDVLKDAIIDENSLFPPTFFSTEDRKIIDEWYNKE